jgi:hypothetical protein
MQRVGWSIGLVLALSAAGARAQEMEVDDELTAEEAVAAQDGPRLSVEYGRSPTQVGFALDIRDGVPFSHALLMLQRDGFAPQRTLVALDEHGAARLIERNAFRGVVVHVSCAIPATVGGAAGDAVLRTAVIDPSSATPPLALTSPGDIVICEIMKDPSFVSDANGEWFEVRNRSNQAIDLEGWKLGDAGTSVHTIHGVNGTMIIQPKAYFVFGVNSNTLTNGGINVGYKYPSSFSLSNAADEIRLVDTNGVIIDVVDYDDGIFWPDDAGKSISLNRGLIDSVLNDDGANWCSSLNPMVGANTDYATPRLANNTCQ